MIKITVVRMSICIANAYLYCFVIVTIPFCILRLRRAARTNQLSSIFLRLELRRGTYMHLNNILRLKLIMQLKLQKIKRSRNDGS